MAKLGVLGFILFLGVVGFNSFGAYAGSGSRNSSPKAQSVANIRNCSAGESEVIRSTDLLMQDRLDLVAGALPKFTLQYVHENFVVPKNRQWTEGSQNNRNYEAYQQRLMQVFSAMTNASHTGINFECKPNYEPNCQNGEVIAYVLFIGNTPLKTMFLCEGFFKDPGGSLETLIHELSHYAASTDDLASNWLNPPNDVNILMAPKDAYHIQNFSQGDVAHVLLRQIWFWNWAPKPKPM